MNIVETQANEFTEYFYEGPHLANLSSLQSELTTKLYDFKRDRDKLDFLKVLRQNTVLQKEEHQKICSKPACQYLPVRDTGLFVIDQEIDEINSYYQSETKSKDKFDPQEESTLHAKLNSIIEELGKLGVGQEIIFNEIDSLKSHFNLGKKSWFQLLKGRLIDLVVEKTLDETLVKEIYNQLSDNFPDVTKQLT